MNVRTFLAAVRLHWKLFLTVLLACVVVGVGGALLAPGKYASTTQLLVSIQGSATATAYENDQVVWGRVNSYVELLTTEAVNQRVVDKLGLSQSARELADNVSATIVPPRTTVIDLAVADASPDQARLLANTLAGEFIAYTGALETPTGMDGQKVHTTVVTSASTPHRRLPGPLTFGALGALVGLVLGAVAVWVRSRMDPVVRTAERAAAVSGLPVLGSVSSAQVADAESLDGYRRLRTRLLSGWSGEVADPALVWVVTCAAAETSTVRLASNLGSALASSGGRVIIVDTDPTGEIGDWEVESHPGLFDVLAGSASVDQAIRSRFDRLPDVLAAGFWEGDPADRLATSTMRTLVHRLRTDYTHVVIAAPPVLSTVAASTVSEYADGVLLVVVLGATRRRDLVRAAEDLRMTGAPVAGIVICTEQGEAPEPDVESTGRSGPDVADETRPWVISDR
ncbi:Wzz/FepE/Etk N-terminal domain-containing protein [Rhodococcus tukisamuensis]|uniref:Capsular polysaccharide biosynthesis protein n=1 Tax=Rhodococcus tukisamuensis TaxID=168276 RepID=A0A1G7APD5_9NOCA|nr:Wzz/FepE/Etk N-terminal domain-containing protein [Rhodococcus tukisamuensis]SDE15746.1 Capsular polysaccharide biosynthesis protein [Rhodococcus tukisamuensis]